MTEPLSLSLLLLQNFIFAYKKHFNGRHSSASLHPTVSMGMGFRLNLKCVVPVQSHLLSSSPTRLSSSAAFFNVGSEEEDDPTKYLPQGFLEKTREIGMVVPSWAAQVAILSHPSIGAFLSHCGWNSSVESLVKGVPMIAWPLYAEQRMNAAMLAEDIEVAIRPSVEEGGKVVGRKEIERAVRAVVTGEEGKRMRRRAREIRDSSVESLSHGGSSQASLAAVCEDWKTKRRGQEGEIYADRAS